MIFNTYFYLLASRIHWPARREVAIRVLRTAKQLGGAQRVIDVGCGPALFVRDVLDMDLDYLGLDTDPAIIEYSRAQFPNNERAKFELEKTCLLADEISPRDVLVFNGVFHHVPADIAQSFWTLGTKAHSVMVGDHFRDKHRITRLNKWLQDKDRGKFVRDYDYFQNVSGFRVLSENVISVPGNKIPVWKYFTNLYVPER